MVRTEAGLFSRLQCVTQSLTLGVHEPVRRAAVSEVLQTSNIDRVKDDVQAGNSHGTSRLLSRGRHSGYLARKVRFDGVEAQRITRSRPACVRQVRPSEEDIHRYVARALPLAFI
jgi:hypothetical protein